MSGIIIQRYSNICRLDYTFPQVGDRKVERGAAGVQEGVHEFF